MGDLRAERGRGAGGDKGALRVPAASGAPLPQLALDEVDAAPATPTPPLLKSRPLHVLRSTVSIAVAGAALPPGMSGFAARASQKAAHYAAALRRAPLGVVAAAAHLPRAQLPLVKLPAAACCCCCRGGSCLFSNAGAA